MAYHADDAFLPSWGSGMRPREPVDANEEFSTGFEDYPPKPQKAVPGTEMDQLTPYGTMEDNFSPRVRYLDDKTNGGIMNERMPSPEKVFPKLRRLDRVNVAEKSLFLLWWPAFLGSCIVASFGLIYWQHSTAAHLVLLFVLAVAVLMLSMGITLTPQDFLDVASEPTSVLMQFSLCYGMMPVLALGLAKAFGVNPALLAGMVLVGSINGGQASNLCTYIAKGNVALSVLMTTATTLGAIFMTPFICKSILGTVVPVDAVGIAKSTIEVSILSPSIGVSSLEKWMRRLRRGLTRFFFACRDRSCLHLLPLAWRRTSSSQSLSRRFSPSRRLWASFPRACWWQVQSHKSRTRSSAPDCLCRYVPAISRKPQSPWLGVVVPLAFGDAVPEPRPSSRRHRKIPLLLLHLVGGLVGYALPRATGFDEVSSRTMAIETSMKSSAFGFLLAKLHFGEYAARVPSAVSVVWMALTGSILAVIWRYIPVKDGSDSK